MIELLSGFGTMPGMLLRYLTGLSTGRLILWCYLIWYLVVLVRYFDPNPRLWLTSLGLSAIIGFALRPLRYKLLDGSRWVWSHGGRMPHVR